MSIATRWPVLLTLELSLDEIDADGHATDAALERVFSDARRVYLDDCETLRGENLEALRTEVRRADGHVTPRGVVIATGVVEIFPEAFVMHARIRGNDDGELVADATCTLTTGGELPVVCRDEFIARAHNARFTL